MKKRRCRDVRQNNLFQEDKIVVINVEQNDHGSDCPYTQKETYVTNLFQKLKSDEQQQLEMERQNIKNLAVKVAGPVLPGPGHYTVPYMHAQPDIQFRRFSSRKPQLPQKAPGPLEYQHKTPKDWRPLKLHCYSREKIIDYAPPKRSKDVGRFIEFTCNKPCMSMFRREKFCLPIIGKDLEVGPLTYHVSRFARAWRK